MNELELQRFLNLLDRFDTPQDIVRFWCAIGENTWGPGIEDEKGMKWYEELTELF